MTAWPLTPLGEIFDIARGGSPRPIQDYTTEDPDGINWIMIGDASDQSKYISTTKRRILTSGVSRSRMVYPGDFLLSNSMSFGRPYILKTSGCIHDGWLVLSCKNGEIDQDYFYHLLGSGVVHSEFERKASGAVVKNLNIDLVKSVKVPLPPLPEQKRIAAILDKADAIRRKRKAALDMADELLRATFLDMFGDPVTNPKGWDVVLFGHVCDVQLGKMLSKKAKIGVNPIPYLNNRVVRWRKFNLSDLPQMDYSERELKKFNLTDGDILACEGGEVGRCAIWRGQLALCSYQKALHRIRPHKNKATSEYIQEYLFWMAQCGGLVDSTSTATIAHLTAVRLKELKLPLPPINAQNAFVGVYKGYVEQAEKMKRLEQDANILFDSLSQRAFRGEL